MTRLVFRALAIADLREIAAATQQRWDAVQARDYVDALRSDIKSLVDFPLRHPLHEIGGQEFRKMRSGQHLIFYRVTGSSVEVVRILHARMDIEPQLRG